jgi:adenylosuccinate synthase
MDYAAILKPYVADTVGFCGRGRNRGKTSCWRGSWGPQGHDSGTYPYVTSPPRWRLRHGGGRHAAHRITNVWRSQGLFHNVGRGPLSARFSATKRGASKRGGDAGEYGRRPAGRRMGWFDAVAPATGAGCRERPRRFSQFWSLSYLDEIPVCVAMRSTARLRQIPRFGKLYEARRCWRRCPAGRATSGASADSASCRKRRRLTYGSSKAGSGSRSRCCRTGRSGKPSSTGNRGPGGIFA